MSKNPFKDEEEKIMRLLVDAYNLSQKLKQTHPGQQQAFADGIHKCQDIIIHRIVQRDYPTHFPTYDKERL